jgi:long-chain acyl-CoA synthetase
MGAGRPFVWEKSYPAGVRWDAPIATSTIPELLDRAVAYRDRRISYRELAASADRAAAAFLRLGTNAPVALYLPNTPYHPVSFFGAMRAGKCAVQLSPLDAKRELAHKLSDSGARTIVTTNLFGLAAKALEHAAAGHVDRVIVGDDAAWGAAASATDPIPDPKCVLAFERLMADSPPPSAWPAVSPNDFALLQFTGATTGVPKAAMLTHGNLTAAVSSYLAWVGGCSDSPTPRQSGS